MEFAEIITHHREKAGFSKKALAEKVQVTQPYIVQIEKDGKVPGDEVTVRLADALGIDRRELLFAAYRAKAIDEVKSYFASAFDDLDPTEEFSQPFLANRSGRLESPDFVLDALYTDPLGLFQVIRLRSKSRDARFSEHCHHGPEVFVPVAGQVKLQVESRHYLLDRSHPKGHKAVSVEANAPHSLVCSEDAVLLVIAFSRVIRSAAAAR